MAEAENKISDSLDIGGAVEADQAEQTGLPAAVKHVKKPMVGGYQWGTGRRKSSVARVRIRPGDGKMIVNKKDIGEFFKREQDIQAIIAPLAPSVVIKGLYCEPVSALTATPSTVHCTAPLEFIL